MSTTEHITPGRVISFWLRRMFDKAVLWLYAKFFAIMLALFLCFPKRQRMSHNNGIAGTGKMRVVDDPEFPPHAFFAPGKEFPVRVRHGSATFLDDAMNCIRSMAIKLSNEQFKSPFDVEMNTGKTSLFWSAISFLKFAKMRKEQYGIEYRDFNRKYPQALDASMVAGRRHASSFHNLHYYCKTPFLYDSDDGLKYYAKYRAIPAEKQRQTGIDTNPSEWDQCNQRILPHETRGRNYLKYEYEDRVAREGAKYKLQIQTRPASEDEDPGVFNNMIPWDEEVFPWHDLGEITIDKTLDWKESTLTTFSVNNMPKGLGVIPANSIFDYNSLNYMRAHSEIARKARLFSYRVFGMVPPIPDNDNRNESAWGK